MIVVTLWFERKSSMTSLAEESLGHNSSEGGEQCKRPHLSKSLDEFVSNEAMRHEYRYTLVCHSCGPLPLRMGGRVGE